jgi:hypothetical protein
VAGPDRSYLVTRARLFPPPGPDAGTVHQLTFIFRSCYGGFNGNTRLVNRHELETVSEMSHRHTIDELTRQSGAYLAEVQDRLLDRYQDVPADRIRRYTKAEAERLADMPVQAFVPILVERAVRNRLEHDGVSQ